MYYPLCTNLQQNCYQSASLAEIAEQLQNIQSVLRVFDNGELVSIPDTMEVVVWLLFDLM